MMKNNENQIRFSYETFTKSRHVFQRMRKYAKQTKTRLNFHVLSHKCVHKTNAISTKKVFCKSKECKDMPTG